MLKTIFLIIISFSLGAYGKILSINQNAPDFSLSDQDGNTYTLSNYKGKEYVVLIFYPGDQTPVCTQQLCEIRDDYSTFSANNAVVFGINPASAQSHKTFAEKNKFPFPLLVDKSKQIASKYHAKRLFMNHRTVYVIDKEGKIIYAKRGKPSVGEILSSFAKKDELKIKIN